MPSETDRRGTRRAASAGSATARPGASGRAYFDFYQRWDSRSPVKRAAATRGSSPTTSATCSPATKRWAPSELALQAMLTSATGFEHHFSGLVASLSLYEAGKFDILDITSKVGCARPARCRGRARRGLPPRQRVHAATSRRSTTWRRVNDPLDDVRADCGITPRG